MKSPTNLGLNIQSLQIITGIIEAEKHSLNLIVDLGNIPPMDNQHRSDDNFNSDYAEEIDHTNTIVLETPSKLSHLLTTRAQNVDFLEEKGVKLREL